MNPRDRFPVLIIASFVVALVAVAFIPARAFSRTVAVAEKEVFAGASSQVQLEKSAFPRWFVIPLSHIPNHAPGSGFENAERKSFASDDAAYSGDPHYAYFEQMICVDYVDLRYAPQYDQPPVAWSKRGDVVRVHERQGTWAFVDGLYWLELKNLCDF